ncbi:MAG: glycosyltransferase [Prevotellaceae bacterium]|jgi:glycosyltransferase involved in cell wall biosynthesis|nr:glycosyltransferase [Prevotellaceae bacterium]
MKLSIIVPVYNVERFLAECIDCLVDQDIDFADYEIILINDGSTDSSLIIANEYMTRFPNIVVYTNENNGQSYTRNYGISKSKGEFIYFIDSDDYIEHNSLGKLLFLMEKYNLDLCGFGLKRVYERNLSHTLDWSCIDYGTPKILTGVQTISEHLYNNGVWWYILRKKVLTDNAIFFENFRTMEDGIFTTELLIMCQKVVILPLQLYYYFYNPNSTVTTANVHRRVKIIEDMHFAVIKFEYLIKLAINKGSDSYALKRIKIRQQSYVYFLLVRELKNKTPYKKIKERLLSIQKNTSAYPLVFFNEEYHSFKYRIFTIILNKSFLIRMICLLNRIFNVIK